MRSQIVKLKRIALRERSAISLVRGADLRGFSEPERGCFRQLRKHAEAAGIFVLPIDALYVSQAELELLSLLTLLQRRRPEYVFDASDELRASLARCAGVLTAKEIKLNCRNMARLANSATGTTFNARPSPYLPGHQVPIVFSAPPWTSLQAKALRFVVQHGSAHLRALKEFGASRAVVNLMHKRRLLLRVRPGVYKPSPEALRWLEQELRDEQHSALTVYRHDSRREYFNFRDGAAETFNSQASV